MWRFQVYPECLQRRPDSSPSSWLSAGSGATGWPTPNTQPCLKRCVIPVRWGGTCCASTNAHRSPWLQYDVRGEGEPGAGGEYNVQVSVCTVSGYSCVCSFLTCWWGVLKTSVCLSVFLCGAAGLRLDQRRGSAAPGPVRGRSDVSKQLGTHFRLPLLPQPGPLCSSSSAAVN